MRAAVSQYKVIREGGPRAVGRDYGSCLYGTGRRKGVQAGGCQGQQPDELEGSSFIPKCGNCYEVKIIRTTEAAI